MSAVRQAARRTPMIAVGLALCSLSQPSGAISIDIGSAAGLPGETVTFEVFIRSVGEANVVALENKITFDPATAIPGTADTPDCMLAETIDKEFLPNYTDVPEDCEPAEDCEQIKVIVGRFDPSDPTTFDPVCFEDECRLYTCNVKIAEDAAAGQYPLLCTDEILSDREGQRFPDTECTDGSISVLDPSVATPTRTPSATRSPTATRTPRFVVGDGGSWLGARHEALLHGGTGDSGSGCQLGDERGGGLLWLLAVPFAVALRRAARRTARAGGSPL